MPHRSLPISWKYWSLNYDTRRTNLTVSLRGLIIFWISYVNTAWSISSFRPFVLRQPSPIAKATGESPANSFGKRARSEEHTSELQSLMRISYAVFCLKKKKTHTQDYTIISVHQYLRF